MPSKHPFNSVLAGAYSRGRTRVGGFHCFGSDTWACLRRADASLSTKYRPV